MPEKTREEIYAELLPTFHKVFADKSITIADETTAADIEAWDSLNHVTLIVSVEQQFGVKFKTVEVTRFANVGELVTSLQGKLAKKG